MSDTRQGFTTATQHAYEVISKEILAQQLKPGQRLPRRTMAELTGVSTVAVIEALHKLEAEGLVESRPHLGARVVSLDAETVRDRCELREAVECQVARILAVKIEEDEISRMRHRATVLDDYSESEETFDLFWENHHAFHLGLAELTGCQSLVDSLRKIGFFLLLQRLHISQHMANSTRENHVEIVEAIASRNPDQAEAKMREHVTSLGRVLKDRGLEGGA